MKQGKWGILLTGVLVAIFLAVWVDPILAEESDQNGEDKKLIVGFLDDREGGLKFGPPLPAEIIIQLTLSSTISDATEPIDASVVLQAMNFVSDEGQPIATDELLTVSNGTVLYEDTVKISEKTEIKEITISVNNNPEIPRGKYTGHFVATIDDGVPVTKSISFTVGSKSAIISPKIVVSAIGCPFFLNEFPETWRRPLSFLCPGHIRPLNLKDEAIEDISPPNSKDEEIEDRFVAIPVSGNEVRIKGFDERYLQTAEGAAVSDSGAGRVYLYLNGIKKPEDCDSHPKKKIISEIPCDDIREYGITLWGSTNSGKYEGQFYLDGADKTTEDTKVDVAVLVKDQRYVPMFFILAGVLMSMGLNYRYGPYKKNKAKADLEDDIKQEEENLDWLVKEFKRKVTEELTPGFYNSPPDIIFEANAVANNASGLTGQDRLSQLENLRILFQRFQIFFIRLYKAMEWLESVENVEKKSSNWSPDCKDILEKIRENLTRAKQRLWIADTERTMESFQDIFIMALLKADGLIKQKCPITHEQKVNLVKISEDVPFVRLKDKPNQKKNKKVQPMQEPNDNGKKGSWEKFRDSFEKNLNSVLWFFLKLFVIVLSGYYVVYLSNETFGSQLDYVWAFLWGLTTATAITAISAIWGSEKGFFENFVGLLGK